MALPPGSLRAKAASGAPCPAANGAKMRPACSGVPPASTGNRPSMVPSKGQRDVDVNGVELLGQYRHVHNTRALTAERCWDQAP